MRTRLMEKYPLVTLSVPVGGRVWQVLAAQDQDALLDVAEGDYFPYGFLLWEASIALAQYVAGSPERVAGKRVLELGAGVGLPGLVARTCGAEVWQTDHHPDTLLLTQVNAFANAVHGIAYFTGDWADWSHPTRYDVLLGADILYERALQFHLEQVFQRNLEPSGTLLLSDPARPQALEFAAHLEKSGWEITLETQVVPRLAEDDTAPPSRSRC